MPRVHWGVPGGVPVTDSECVTTKTRHLDQLGSVSLSRNATQARSRKATQYLTVSEAKHRWLYNPRGDKTKRHSKAKGKALSKHH